MEKLITIIIINNESLRIVIFSENGIILNDQQTDVIFNKRIIDKICLNIEMIQQKYPAYQHNLIISLNDLLKNQKLIKMMEGQIISDFDVTPVIINNDLLSLYSVSKHYQPAIVVSSFEHCSVIGRNKNNYAVGLGYDGPFSICCYESLVFDRIKELLKVFESGKKLRNSDEEILKLFGVSTVRELVTSVQELSKRDLQKIARKFAYDSDNLNILKNYGRMIASNIRMMIENLAIDEPFILAFRGDFIVNNRFLRNIILNNLYAIKKNSKMVKMINYHQLLRLETKAQDLAFGGYNYFMYHNTQEKIV